MRPNPGTVLFLERVVRSTRYWFICRSLSSSSGSSMSTGAETGEELKVTRLGGSHLGVTVLSINRPELRNAISFPLIEQIKNATIELPYDGTTKVVVLSSEHKGIFCAGADLKERLLQSVEVYTKWSHSIRAVFQDLASLPLPVLAAVDGHALGGGLELALAADIRVAATNAKIGLPETGLAIIPGAGGTQRLSRLVGPAIAKELIFTGQVLNSEEAQRLGVVNYSVEQNEEKNAAYQRCLHLAETILDKGTVAIRMAKQAIGRGIEMDLSSGLEMEKASYAQVIPTEDRIEGLKAFRDKRKPVYKGK